MTREILADITADAGLATQIIARHRSMLRNHHPLKKQIDLHEMIAESLALVARDMKASRIDIILDLSSTPAIVDGDTVLLKQVLINLLRNAMDALEETPSSRRHITLRTAVRTDAVDISVSDTGIGLSADVVGKLFTPFATTKAHGLGIGLTIVQRIVEEHGGTIAARGNPNGGATFTITLPRSTAAAIAPEPRAKRNTPQRVVTAFDPD